VPQRGRRASCAPNYTTAKTQAQDRITAVLGAPAGSVHRDDPRVADDVGRLLAIDITVSWDYAGSPVVPSAPLMGIWMPNTITSHAVVQYS